MDFDELLGEAEHHQHWFEYPKHARTNDPS